MIKKFPKAPKDGLAAVATIAQAVDTQVCGIGGITKAEDILEYIMLGASTIQIGTSILINGFGIINELLKDLEEWLDNSKYENLNQVTGKALSALKSFEEMKVEPYSARLKETCKKETCKRCQTSCMYRAVSYDIQGIQINKNQCAGCGMCVSVCPDKKIELVWK